MYMHVYCYDETVLIHYYGILNKQQIPNPGL